MHVLHRILVHIPDACNVSGMEREEIIDSVRSQAESRTEEFADIVYDWRETETAGGWSEEYPENVLLGSESQERLIEELEEVRKFQCGEIEANLASFKERAGNSLTAAVNMMQVSSEEQDGREVSMARYYLKKLAKLLCGEYNCDSGFYDTESYSARVDNGTLEKVRRKPEDWALVCFDYHY